MKSIRTLVGIVVVLSFVLFTSAQAIEIFVWDNDNDLRVTDPVYRTSHTATDAVTRTLRDLELDYTLNRNLPDNLEDYDVLITCLSFYCPG